MPRDKQMKDTRRQEDAPVQNGIGAAGPSPSPPTRSEQKGEHRAVRTCAQCGKTIAHLGAFCQSCGAPLYGDGPGHQVQNHEDRGGPGAFILQSLKNSFYGFLGLLKNPLLLLPALLLAGLWLGLSLAKTQFPTAWPIRILSFFTFAQGGMYAGLLGAVGGIAGKAFLAWFVTGIVLALRTKQKPFGDTAQKWRVLLSLFTVKQVGEAAMMIGGGGAALVAYNFFTGNGALENSLIGIMAAAAAFRTLKKTNCFFKGLILSFQGGKTVVTAADHGIAGLTLGFLLSVLISFLHTGWIWYLLGGLLLTVAIVLGLIGGGKRRTVKAGTVCLIFLLALPFSQAGAFADGGAWVLKETAHFEETESGEITWIEDDIVFSADYRTGHGSFSYTFNGEANGDWFSGESATGTMTHEELPQRIGGNESVEIPVTGAISKNEVGGGLFGIAISIHYLAKPFTSLDDGFREGEFFLTKGGEENFWVSAARGGGAGKTKDLLQSPQLPSGSVEGDGRHLTIVTKMTARNGGNVLHHYYDVYQYEWTGDGGGQSAGESEGEWLNPYDAYGIAAEDHYELQKALREDPPVGIRFIPASASLDGIFTSYRVETDIDQDPWVTFLSFATLGPADTYTLERGNRIEFSVQSDTLYEQIQDADSPAVASGSLSANFAWTMPTSLQEDASSYLTTYTNFIQIDSDFNLNAQVNDFEGDEAGLRPAPYNGNHSDEWNLSSKAFLTGKEGGITPSREKSCWLVVGLSPALEHLSVTEGVPGVLYFEVVEVKRGDWSTIPVAGGDEEEEEDGKEGEDGDDLLGFSGALVLGIGAAVAAALGAGAAAAAGGGPPRLPDSPYIEQDEEDPSTIIISYPTGGAERFRWNEKSGAWEDPRGNTLETDRLDWAMASQAEDLRRAAIERERMAAGTDGDSQHWHKIEKTREIQREMENLDDPDGLGARVAQRLQKIRDDLDAGKGFDQTGYEKARNVYGKIVAGTMAKESELPEAYTNWQNWRDMVQRTGAEVARGKGWKAIAVRIGSAVVTGGYSEFGFEISQATMTMKDYVEAGGDSATEAFGIAATQAIVNEGIGRSIGLGIKIGGSALHHGSKIITGPVAKAINAAKPIVTDLARKAAAASAKIANNAAKALKAAKSGVDDLVKAGKSQIGDLLKAGKSQADDLAQAAKGQIDDGMKAAKGQIDDGIKAAKGQADDAAKAAAGQSDDLAKAAAKPGEQAAEKTVKPEDAFKQAKKNAEDFMEQQRKAAQKEADELIQRYRNEIKKSPELSKRHEAFLQGREAAEQRIAEMDRAKKALDQNPRSAEAKQAYENAVQEVQKDKHAIHKLNEMGESGTDVRSDFNTAMKQKEAVADLNTRRRIAEEYRRNPDEVYTVNASNKMDAKDAFETAGVAKRPKDAVMTDGRQTVSGSLDDVQVPRDPGTKTGFDTDKTYRIKSTVKDPVTGQMKETALDIPAENVKRIYNEEYYKQWHNGKLPTKMDAAGKEVVDTAAVNQFAKDMDVAAVDMRSAEAYGMGGSDLQNAIKSDGSVKNFKDISSVTKTMEHKSTEWKHMADDLRKTGDGNALPKAESWSEESIRQGTKQFENQVVGQINALNTQLKNNTYRLPKDLATHMEILKRIGGKPGDISVAEAEAILNAGGTSIDNVLQQSAALMESMDRLRLQ